jgi:hypothetical protein
VARDVTAGSVCSCGGSSASCDASDCIDTACCDAALAGAGRGAVVSTLRRGRVARAREEMVCIVIAGVRETS